MSKPHGIACWIGWLLCGCSATGVGNQLVVELKTDLVPMLEFHTIRTEIAQGSTNHAAVMVEQPADALADYTRSARIGEFLELRAEEITVAVTLLDENKRVVASRPTRITLEERFGLTVLITRDCRDIQCPLAEGDPALTACFGGRCADPRCHPLAPAYCPLEPECTGDDQCLPTSECALGVCTDAVCFYVPDETPCDASEMCHVDEGCIQSLPQPDPTCEDGLQNGDEVDTDCGGSCTVGCGSGSICVQHGDCTSDYCNEAKLCADSPVTLSRAFIGSGVDVVTAVGTDSNDDVYLTGYYSDTMTLGGATFLDVGTGDDSYVAKLDASGNHVWSFALQNVDDDVRALDIATTSSGLVYVGGYFEGSVDFGGGPIAANLQDIFVAAYDSSGAFRWARRFGSSSNDDFRGLAADEAGNVYFTAASSGTANYGGGNVAGYTRVMVSLDVDGNYRWQLARNGLDMNAIATNASLVCITGMMNGSIDFGGGTITGDFDLYVACFDTAGVHQWSDSYPADGYLEESKSIAIDPNKNVVILGTMQSSGVDFGAGALPVNGSKDLFVASFTGLGAYRWAHAYGTSGSDAAGDIAIHSDSTIFATGHMSASVDFGGGSIPQGNLSHVFLVGWNTEGNHVFSQGYAVSAGAVGLAFASDSVAVVGTYSGTIDFGKGAHTSTGTDVFLVQVAP